MPFWGNVRSEGTIKMIGIVDARNPNSLRPVWGLTVVERNCHMLAECGVRDIVIVTTDGRMSWKNQSLTHRVHIAVIADSNPLSGIVHQYTSSDVIVMDGSVLYDKRVLQKVYQESSTGILLNDAKTAAVLKMRSQDGDGLSRLSFQTLADLLIPPSSISTWTLDSIDPYVPALRHRVRPHMIPVHDDAARRLAEATLFKLAYKGGLDFIYQFVYRHIVRLMIRLLSKTHITPNHVTLTYLAIAIAAMPVMAFGHVGWGLLICLAAMIGDAADGVLARITFQTSKLGHRLDKHSHRIYHSLWYVSAGYGLAGGDIQSPIFWNSFGLVAIYLISRMVTGKYKDRFKISIFDITPYDRLFRYVSGARWNINMLILGIGVIVKHEIQAFLIMTAWGLVALFVWSIRHFTSGPVKTL